MIFSGHSQFLPTKTSGIFQFRSKIHFFCCSDVTRFFRTIVSEKFQVKTFEYENFVDDMNRKLGMLSQN